jgi:hypothetical protein
MIYGIAMLLFILGLVVGIPALRRLLRMQSIKRKSQITLGRVESTDNAINIQRSFMGMFVADEVTNHQRPLIRYQPAHEKEMSIEIIPSTFLSGRRYETGESVEVVYDLSEPWRAYPLREWTATARDLWIGSVISATALILWILGRLYNLPF